MAYKRGNCVITLACVKQIGKKVCIRKVERKGKEIEREKLLNGHFWQLNGTDRGSECKRCFFFGLTEK